MSRCHVCENDHPSGTPCVWPTDDTDTLVLPNHVWVGPGRPPKKAPERPGVGRSDGQ